ncbi:MAG: glycosyltransferase family 39 protein [Candidatus Latescibacterota bacterium]|nr:MAG: glycosyltransferase family 39 protein [Candidatus Latescibacterota bacterium]
MTHDSSSDGDVLTSKSRADRSTPWFLVSAFALVHVVIHLATNGNYGMFRDEFYYWDCANHLAWGYVDQPPLSIALLAGWKTVFGDSVDSLRVLPALCGAFVIVMIALIARELGGGRFAQAFAALAVAAIPSYLGITGFYSMNAFDLVFWTVGFYIVLRIVNDGRQILWIWLGLVLGLGLLNKISILVFGFSLILSMILTRHRRHLARPQFWIGVALAGLIFLPHVIWQIGNGWPTLEFIENAKRNKIADIDLGGFLGAQAMEMGPTNLGIWVLGLLFLLIARSMRRYQIFGWFFLITLIYFVVQKSKPYYLFSVYPVLFAAGAVLIERVASLRRLGWIRPLAVLNVVIGLVIALPMAVPLLSVESYVAYTQRLGMAPSTSENHELAELPQFFADRFGWEEMVAEVAAVYESLSDSDKARCGIVGRNYGETGAINYYGRRYGLPRAASQHNNYFLWGPGEMSGDVLIVVNYARSDLEMVFESVTLVTTLDLEYAMPYEANAPIYVCRGLRIPFDEAWRMGKSFI